MTVQKTKMLHRAVAMIACMFAIVFASSLLCVRPAAAAEVTNLALNKTAVADSEERRRLLPARQLTAMTLRAGVVQKILPAAPLDLR